MNDALDVTANENKERRIALVIGNAQYVRARTLINTLADASGVADALSRVGFTSHLLSSQGEPLPLVPYSDLSLIGMKRLLADFNVASRKADMSVVYFSGHGIEIEFRNFLIPVDAELAHVARVDYEAVPLAEIIKATIGAKRLRLVILDACRDNPFVERMDGLELGKSAARGGLGAPGSSISALTFYAATEGQIAKQGPKGGRSPFANALITRLLEPRELLRVFGKITEDVRSKTGGQQEPRLYGPLPGDDIFLMPSGATAPPPPPPPPPATSANGLPPRPEEIHEHTIRGPGPLGKAAISLFFATLLASALVLMANYGALDSFLALFRPNYGVGDSGDSSVGDISSNSDSSGDSHERGEKPVLQYARQGWSAEDRQLFYTTSQGSHMIPYLWFKALRRLDVDKPFGGDQLARYGYLPNDKSKSNPEGLPVGFVIDGDTSTGFFGMTCAACHTAQIEYQKDGATQQLRIDGAPATADFQAFLIDLSAATRATLSDADRFDKFARAVLGNRYSATRANDLKTDFAVWVIQWGDFMDKSLPASHWGPGRLDAFGMIFNRVAGKDLGIDANFKVADAPVSYPFLWNASLQNQTQWNGGVPNGLFINALGRNSGKVFGVFAEFSPKKLTDAHPPLIDYSKNSIKFAGLQALEEKIAILKPPPWPFELKQDLVARGRVLFAQNCGSCHDEKPLPNGTWFTPVNAVGTDPRMFNNANRSSQSGVLKGALSPNRPGSTLPDPASTNDVLATAVAGTLLNYAFPPPPKFIDFNSGVWQAIRKDLAYTLPAPQDLSEIENLKSHVLERLANLFVPLAPDAPPAYESRVLHGIWATAPYLHNGSVPNLWELLLPPERRKPSFMVGSRVFDPVNVGYVTDSSPFKDGKLVVGPGAEPGNSNAGHDFGKDLSDDERWALVEYLKQL